MVTDSEGYTHLVQFLKQNQELFKQSYGKISVEQPLLEFFEEQLSAQVILICGQHPNMSFEQRNNIIREVDAIVIDLEQILAEFVDMHMTREQALFITEYAGLIKNLFDTSIATMMSTYRKLDAS